MASGRSPEKRAEKRVKKDASRRRSTVSRWFRYITDAAEAFKSKEVKAGGKLVVESPSPISAPTPVVPIPDVVEAETTTEDEDRPEKEERPVSWDEPLRMEPEPLLETPKLPLEPEPELEPSPVSELELESKEPELPFEPNKSSSSTDSLETVDKVEVPQPQLIQPEEVVVSDTVFVAETTEPVIPDTALYEKLRAKNQEVLTAMSEKKKLVAELLEIPLGDYEYIAEMSCELTGEKESKELLLASMHQMDNLTQLVNSGLKLTPRTGHSEHAADGSEASADMSRVMLHLPSKPVLDATKNLNELLTHLLSAMVQRDQEHEALKVELQIAQQKLAELTAIGHHTVTGDQSDSSSRRSSAEMIDATDAGDTDSADVKRRDSSEVSQPSRPESFESATSLLSESTEVPETQRHSQASSVDDDSAVFSVTSLSNDSVSDAQPLPPPDLIGPITEQVEDDDIRYNLVDDLPLPPPPLEHLGKEAGIVVEGDEETETDYEEDEVAEVTALAPPQHSSNSDTMSCDVTDTTDSTDTDSTGTTVVGAKF